MDVREKKDNFWIGFGSSMQLADYQYTSYLSLVVLHESKTIASFSWQGNEMTSFFH